MKKNVASQVVGAQLNSKTDGSAVTTGTTTCYVLGDGGTQAAGSVGSGACTHEGNGFWTYTPAQAETNYDHVAFTFVNTSAVIASVQIYPSFPQTGDNYVRLGAPAGASVSADIAAVKVDTAAIKTKTDFLPSATAGAAGGVFIAGTNAATSVTTALTANVIGNVTGNLSGSVGSVTGAVGSVTGAVGSVTGAVGSVTGNVGGNVVGSVASVTARVTANADQLAGQTVTAAAGVTFPTSVASPTNITAGTITTVTNLTNAPTSGDLTATMKTSVTTAATAATPVAASVTGNVGGNVVGSVGSVATGGIVATSFAAGAIDASAIATDAIGSAELAASAASEIATAVRTELTAELARVDVATSTRLAPTTAGRTLDVSAGGEAGLDWANIGSPNSTVNLGATAIDSVVSSIGGNVNGSVGSVSGNIGGNLVGSVGSLSVASISNASFAADTGMKTARSNTAQAGASGSITLDASASATTDFYVGDWLYVTGGTGVGQTRVITAYNGTSKVATIAPNWATNPDNTSTFAVRSAAQVTGVQGAVTGAVGSVTGNVGGSVASVTARVTANTDQLAGQTVSAAAGVTFPTSVASPTNITAGTITTVTNLTNAPTAGDLTATMKASVTTAATAATPTAAAVTGNVGGNVVGSVGSVATGGITSASFAASAINAAAIAADAITDAKVASDVTIASVTGSVGSVTGNVGGSVASVTGLTASDVGAIKVVTDRVGTALQDAGDSPTTYRFTPTALSQTPAAPSAATVASAVRTELTVELGRIDASISSRLPTSGYTAPDNATITAIAGYIDTEVAAIKSVTDKLDYTLQAAAGSPTAYQFNTFALALAPTGGSAPTAADIADAVLDEALAGHGTAGTLGEAVATVRSLVEVGAGSPSYFRLATTALEQAPTGGSAPSAAAIADAVWDEARAGHVSAGTFGEGVASVQGNVTGNVGGTVASVVGSVGSVTGSVASVTGNVGGNVVGSIGSLATQAKADVNAEADTALSDVGVTTTVTGRIDAAITTRLASAGYTAPDNASITAIKAKTDNLPTDPADASDIATALALIATPLSLVKTVTDKLGDTLEPAGSPANFRFSAGALAQAPAASINVSDFADALLDESIATHQIPGSVGKAITDAGAGGNPWETFADGVHTYGEMVQVLAAVAAGKSLIVDLGGDAATVTFRNLTDDTDTVVATMAGSERAAVTINT